MEIVVRSGGQDAELDVVERPPDCTLAGLLQGAGLTVPPLVHVDDRPVPAGTPLDASGLRRGSVLAVDGPPASPPSDGPELVVVAGPGAGRRTTLGPGRWCIGPGRGRHDLDTGTVEAPALNVDVGPHATTVCAPGGRLDGRALGADAVAWTDELLVAGGRAFALRRPLRVGAAPAARCSIGRRPDGAGTQPFNRPPRPGPEPEPDALVVPERPRRAGDARRFPLLAIIAPLPVAVGVAALFGQWRFLAFGLLSPIMLAANWLEDRRTRRSERSRAAREHTVAVARFRRDVTGRHALDVARRRRASPSIVDVVDWLRTGHHRLWERRGDHHDAMQIPVGVADQPWSPPLHRPPNALDDADDLVAGAGGLPAVPLVVDLAGDRGLGLVGPRPATHAAARGVLLAAAALHGPADLGVVVLASDAGPAWDWAKWLPHARGPDGVDVCPGEERAGEILAAAARAGRTLLVVADGPGWWTGRSALLRPAVADVASAVRLLALAERVEDLPATCTAVVGIAADGSAAYEHLGTRQAVRPLLVHLVDTELAADAGRRLARYDDPERSTDAASALPAEVSVLEVLDLPEPSAGEILRRWRATDRRASLPLGVGRDGVVDVDLVADGPHGLVAGTTGAGKSELLRTVVAGLATSLSPAELNVVLIDFKGGAAFDSCARLPHTVALVTDLDDHLAGRALRCLRAELAHRERVLRDAGVSTVDEQRRADPGGALPRLLVVIDEFAQLAGSVAGFLTSLVDIAQRGRSLGLHLLLATQRPAGVVDHKIRANTNLRIALRVQDDADSIDVVGVRDAAAVSRRRPGRAFARFGAGELVELQTATTSGTFVPPRAATVRLRPFAVARPPSGAEHRFAAPAQPATTAGGGAGHTDLERLVHAITAAAQVADLPALRRPYVEPLPGVLTAERLTAAMEGGADGPPVAGAVPFALVDHPDEQRQTVGWWRPGPGASLALYGIPGSGTSSTLATLALGVARRWSPDDAHLYVFDLDAGLLGALAELPHTGAVVTLEDAHRLTRLARRLAGEVQRRRQLAVRLGSPAHVIAGEPAMIVLVDNIGALRQAVDATRDLAEAWAALESVARDGPALGITIAVTAQQERALPPVWAAVIVNRLLFRLADVAAYAGFGVRPAAVPPMCAGRLLRPDDGAELQVVSPPPDLAAAAREVSAAASGRRRRPPMSVAPLPTAVTTAAVAGRARVGRAGWTLPIGIDLVDGALAAPTLPHGSTFVVTGPARSGRTTVLRTLLTAARAADGDGGRYAVGPGATALAGDGLAVAPRRPEHVAAWVDVVLAGDQPRLVVVDDADALDGPSLVRLATARPPSLTVVLAGAPEALRSVTHWARPLLRTRAGLLLEPAAGDGDLLRAALPPRLPRFPPGHGYLVDGARLVPVRCATADAL